MFSCYHGLVILITEQCKKPLKTMFQERSPPVALTSTLRLLRGGWWDSNWLAAVISLWTETRSLHTERFTGPQCSDLFLNTLFFGLFSQKWEVNNPLSGIKIFSRTRARWASANHNEGTQWVHEIHILKAKKPHSTWNNKNIGTVNVQYTHVRCTVATLQYFPVDVEPYAGNARVNC